MHRRFLHVLALTPCILTACAFAGNEDETATVRVVNGESGCTLDEVYLTSLGESRGANLAGEGIRFNGTPGTYEVEPEQTYSLSVSSNTGTSNLIPEANCSLTVAAGETRIVTYSYAGGPSLFWGTLSGCN
ncbi:MAG: hypothetical protein JW751_24365 [Polyangiaceae bacterium]|nr:hypothetical protein [Polyangiaceae bacterium]